jgi:hypothetical protein
MKGCFQVKGNGKGGGPTLYWTEDLSVDLLYFSDRHIDVHVGGGPFEQMWRGTFVNAEPKPTDHHKMWAKLRQIKLNSDRPWLMMGGFNEAMWQEEHFSQMPHLKRLMLDFRDVLSHCDLHNLGFVGTPWTFDN